MLSKFADYRPKLRNPSRRASPTFQSVCDRWWEGKSRELAPGSLKTYVPCVARAVDVFGGYRMDEITGGEIAGLLNDMKDAGFSQDIEENGETFEENALIKARAVCGALSLPALADDSGLCVDALNGAPGVYSARYAGEPTDDHRNNMKLLDALDGVTDRSAQFVSVICYIDQDGQAHYFRGECAGSIGFEELGKIGFGYDPIFYVPDLECSTAQLSMEEKNKRSHRGNALRQIKDQLAAYI